MRLFVTLLFTAFSFVLFGQEVSARYELVKMDKTVNTFRHEAAPVVSPDGKSLYFFVQNHPENTFGKDDTQDIWVSRKDENGVWSPAEHMRNPFNIHPSCFRAQRSILLILHHRVFLLSPLSTQ